MRTRFFLKAVGSLAAASMLASFGPLAQAQSALDDVMAKKRSRSRSRPTSAPYGFVGTDLQPQGLDIDMAQLIAPSSA
jgi:polar amino acid transport system substrate-binding protein